MKSLSPVLALCLGVSFASADPLTNQSSLPQIRHLEWGSYAMWGIGMGALFTGYVYDGKGSESRFKAQTMYDQAKAGTAVLNVDEYHSLRKSVSNDRSLRNQWFGVGTAFLLSASAMYAYSVYLDHQWKLQLSPSGAQIQVNFGGK